MEEGVFTCPRCENVVGSSCAEKWIRETVDEGFFCRGCVVYVDGVFRSIEYDTFSASLDDIDIETLRSIVMTGYPELLNPTQEYQNTRKEMLAADFLWLKTWIMERWTDPQIRQQLSEVV